MNIKKILIMVISLSATQAVFAENDNTEFIFSGAGCPHDYGSIVLTGKNVQGIAATYLGVCSTAENSCLDPLFPNIPISNANKAKCENAKKKLVELYPSYLKELPANSPLIPKSAPGVVATNSASPEATNVNINKEEKHSSLGCGRKDQYIFCSDNEIYEKVSPAVAVQLHKEIETSSDSNRSSQKKNVGTAVNIIGNSDAAQVLDK